MTWSWLEPDGAALRLRHLCRQGRVLLAEWRRLCVGACPKAPAMPPTWPGPASDEASTSSREGVGDCWRELREAHAVPSEDDPDLNVPMRARKKKAHHRCRPSQASAGRSPLSSFNNNHNHNNHNNHNNNTTTTQQPTTTTNNNNHNHNHNHNQQQPPQQPHQGWPVCRTGGAQWPSHPPFMGRGVPRSG